LYMNVRRSVLSVDSPVVFSLGKHVWAETKQCVPSIVHETYSK